MAAADSGCIVLQDVALLQEVFVGSDAAMLAAAAAQGALKHSQYFPSGYLGGELLILSRWPIQYIRSAPCTCACLHACCPTFWGQQSP